MDIRTATLQPSGNSSGSVEHLSIKKIQCNPEFSSKGNLRILKIKSNWYDNATILMCQRKAYRIVPRIDKL